MPKEKLSLLNRILTSMPKSDSKSQHEKSSSPLDLFALLPMKPIRYILFLQDFTDLIALACTSQHVRAIVIQFMSETSFPALLAYQMLTSQSPEMIDQKRIPMVVNSLLFRKAERAIRDHEKCPKRIEDRALYIKMVQAMNVSMQSVFSTRRLKHDLTSHLSCCGEQIIRQPQDKRGLDLINFDVQFYQPPKPVNRCELAKPAKQPPTELRIYYKGVRR